MLVRVEIPVPVRTRDQRKGFRFADTLGDDRLAVDDLGTPGLTILLAAGGPCHAMPARMVMGPTRTWGCHSVMVIAHGDWAGQSLDG